MDAKFLASMRYDLTQQQIQGLLALITLNGVAQLATDTWLYGNEGDVVPMVDRVMAERDDLRALRQGSGRQVSHDSLEMLLPFLWRVGQAGFERDRYRTANDLLHSANGLGRATAVELAIG